MKTFRKPPHPFRKYPLRVRRFFNNFMMSKSKTEYHNVINWNNDIAMYRYNLIYKISIPDFRRAEKIFQKHGFVSEKSDI